jgi:hypothetical protein
VGSAPKKHEIVIQSLLAYCPSLVERYRLEGDRLVLIHHETGFQNSETVYTVTYSDLTHRTMPCMRRASGGLSMENQ